MSLQKEIINKLNVKPFINNITTLYQIINYLKNYLMIHCKIKKLIVGISGGQDSALVGKIAQITINEIRKKTLDKNYKFFAIRLPYGKQNDEKDCQDVLNFIQPDRVFTINIKNTITASEKSLHKAGIKISDFVKGNMKARERMKIQYAIANLFSGIVLGTDHAAEAVTGFYTKYGDGASDINPIAHLNKRQGKQLLKFLGCPAHIYFKNPKPGLEDNAINLKDESILGVTYNLIDNYLEGKKVDKFYANIIENLYLKNFHKYMLPLTIFQKL
ncbi:ammonia-dependent NAD(+) synthetase [Candidatus Tachikawaea gelatinosa]|uniref:NH(3)-dependent NAD(+) synthetase n=1 Tax=Candidatus Tachikawaea gelatinosa TaxID=1410383 RepID=A0A090AQ99_9ENTR|nr:ammonia-dependent NAD(+) synthetase [Candidatus Tachikawaea gelatinosa]BAP58522.1 NH(3)-dependent NAD(+) synthetase [Candidatus Tachikawaea gelatinosa]